MRVLIVEDEESRLRWFRANLIGSVVDETKLVGKAIELLQENDYGQIFLDHDLKYEHYATNERDDENTGYAVAQFLADRPDLSPNAQIIVHSLNPSGSDRMIRALHKGRRNYRKVPFIQLKELAKPNR